MNKIAHPTHPTALHSAHVSTVTQVLYILKIFQDAAVTTAHVSSVCEFVLGAPCLSFAIMDIRRFVEELQTPNFLTNRISKYVSILIWILCCHISEVFASLPVGILWFAEIHSLLALFGCNEVRLVKLNLGNGSYLKDGVYEVKFANRSIYPRVKMNQVLLLSVQLHRMAGSIEIHVVGVALSTHESTVWSITNVIVVIFVPPGVMCSTAVTRTMMTRTRMC